ncbi:Haloalkane dehalogenase [Enhygromyxa salina]|uniref:Haloalkane dehalogenase n=1 Tax=Enhygromyxa salina TaxID=215803 RepID=A0A2S9XKA3_9BACT|nr:alpha/beta fold hydrolase [Enhygromyxa salina]PRP93160.1 Haloalkane dehalogenase [Enhygromyxa salina]
MIEVAKVSVDGLEIAYRECGEGRPVLLIHGWPTSSFLWRNVMPGIAAHRRVIAIDLPGFGDSSKPLDRSYSFRMYERVLDGFLDALSVDELGLCVHDLGGPIGLYWASQNSARIERLALCNTLAYPELSWAAKAFLAATVTPGFRRALTSQWGLAQALRLGVSDRSRLPPDAIEGIQRPFQTAAARKALLAAGRGLSQDGLETIASWLPRVDVPVRIIYGARDRILPDIRKTVDRLVRDLPQAEVSVFDDCGHFLQEERPAELGELLGQFFE